jgi:tetratricopeptide (TPR) repeat protein
LAESHLRPGDARHPDNEAVCLTFQLACQLADDPGESLTYLTEKRRWGGETDQAGQSSHEAHYHFQLGKLAFSGGSFFEGERHLRRAIQLDADEQVYREQLSVLYIGWAHSLSNRIGARLRNLSKSITSFLAEARRGGQNLLHQPRQLHRQALEKIRLAREFAPPDRQAEIDVERAAITSPLDWYWITLRGVAISAIEKKHTQHYADLARALESFPAAAVDRRMQEARPLRAVLYHYLQESAWDAGDLDGAVGFAEKAVDCDPSHPVLKETLEQLQHIRDTGGMQHWRRVAPGANNA